MKLRNLNKRILFLLFAAFLAHAAYSQENYVKGYVILKSGDTIHGFIDYRNWHRNPDKIAFKEKLSDDKTSYTPINCKAFSVLDENYESAIIPVEISSRNTNHLDYEPKLKMRTDTTFLQTLIQGKKSLYFYLNDLGNEHFFIKNDSAFELLIYKKYLTFQNTIIENKKFRGQLIIYLNDGKTLHLKFERLEYRRNSLSKLIRSYYDGTGSKIEFQKKAEKAIPEFGALAGISFIPEISSSSLNSSQHTNSSVNMAVGLSLNIILPRTQRKLSIYNELIYAPCNVIMHNYQYIDGYQHTITDSDTKHIMFFLNNMIRFQYPVKKAFIFSDFGISTAYSVQKVNYVREEKVFHSIITITENYNYPNSTGMGYAFTYGLGLRYKEFSFETMIHLFSFSKSYFLLGYKL